jgi:hypothetical protein
MNPHAIPVKTYLGDSVYCDFDGCGYVLTTENGFGPSNTIILEPEVFQRFVAYVKSVNEFRANPDAI